MTGLILIGVVLVLAAFVFIIQQQLRDIRGTVDNRMREQFESSSKLIRSITEELTRVEEGNKHLMGFAEQLRSLQDILKNPKQRGILGEYYLETILKNALPPNRYRMHYRFADGEIVDAVIFLEQGKILPIDSKFSLENYNRTVEETIPHERERLEKLFKADLKNRIDETSKYIRPAEGTMDYAFMFIPSEGIYYDLLINQVGAIKTQTVDLIEYAFQKRHVVIVSPNTFMAYLQTVLQGLRALQIEGSAKEIRERVVELGRHLGAYAEYMTSLGRSLGHAVGHYNRAGRAFKKLDKDVLRISGEGTGATVEVLEKPDTE